MFLYVYFCFFIFFSFNWDSQELCVNPTMDTICYSPKWAGFSHPFQLRFGCECVQMDLLNNFGYDPL